jgi:hypothetical protein
MSLSAVFATNCRESVACSSAGAADSFPMTSWKPDGCSADPGPQAEPLVGAGRHGGGSAASARGLEKQRSQIPK